jgi:hypothetical protein
MDRTVESTMLRKKERMVMGTGVQLEKGNNF